MPSLGETTTRIQSVLLSISLCVKTSLETGHGSWTPPYSRGNRLSALRPAAPAACALQIKGPGEENWGAGSQTDVNLKISVRRVIGGDRKASLACTCSMSNGHYWAPTACLARCHLLVTYYSPSNPLGEGETNLFPFYLGKRKFSLREVEETTAVTSLGKELRIRDLQCEDIQPQHLLSDHAID